MAAAVNKQKILEHVLTALKKKYDVAEQPARAIMEHLLYSIVREGTTTTLADKAFKGILDRFVDLNEIRVSTVQELCDAMGPLPDVASRATRLIGIKEGAKKISRLNDANDFSVAWVMQHGLGGHAVPLDTPSIRVLRRLGILDGESESLESLRGTIEHFVPKAKGAAMVELLSQVAAELCVETNPKCAKCPLLPDCPAGQEFKGAEPKPRKSR